MFGTTATGRGTRDVHILFFFGHPDYPATSASTARHLFPSSDPDRPAAVVVLMNLHHGDAWTLAATLMKIVTSSATVQEQP